MTTGSSASSSSGSSEKGAGRVFHTTRWSLVAAAADRDEPGARDALSQLCEAYWYPVYGYFRRRGASESDAPDLTQAFFARLIEKRDFGQASPERGRFRAYLLGCARNFLANQDKQAAAQKRGGDVVHLSIDPHAAESRYRAEPEGGDDPELLYQRGFARELLEQVLGRLEQEYLESGKGSLFRELRPLLLADGDAAPYRELARRLDRTEGNLKVAALRMRRRFAELLRAEIAATVEDPAQVEEEVDALFELFAS